VGFRRGRASGRARRPSFVESTKLISREFVMRVELDYPGTPDSVKLSVRTRGVDCVDSTKQDGLGEGTNRVRVWVRVHPDLNPVSSERMPQCRSPLAGSPRKSGTVAYLPPRPLYTCVCFCGEWAWEPPLPRGRALDVLHAPFASAIRILYSDYSGWPRAANATIAACVLRPQRRRPPSRPPHATGSCRLRSAVVFRVHREIDG